MRTRAALACFVLHLAACDHAPADAGVHDAAVVDGMSGTPEEQATFAALLSYAQAQLTATHTPGASIAVVLHGRLTFVAALGTKDGTNPTTEHTLFRVASMSKMVLAATAMSLFEEGKLDLQKPITSYLPWFKLASGFDASTITTDDLLTHTSGFPCDTLQQCVSVQGTDGARQAWFAAHPQPLWSPPGLISDYSNFGYALASLVVTSAAGVGDTGYEQLVAERVFDKAGMTTATFDAATAQGGDYAVGYDLDASGNVLDTDEPADFDCPLLHPPGGILATATDYAHFIEALLGGTMLKPSSVMAMEAPHANLRAFADQSYGYGLISQSYPYGSHTMIWHDGALPGFSSILNIVPDYGFGIVVLVNALGSSDPANDIAFQGMTSLYPPTEAPPTLTTPPSAWSAYAGTYSDPWGELGTLSISVSTPDGGAPSLHVDSTPATFSGTAEQEAGDEWALPDPNETQATFYPNDAGLYDRVVTRLGTAVRQ